jgi:hypothetical protein
VILPFPGLVFLARHVYESFVHDADRYTSKTFNVLFRQSRKVICTHEKEHDFSITKSVHSAVGRIVGR